MEEEFYRLKRKIDFRVNPFLFLRNGPIGVIPEDFFNEIVSSFDGYIEIQNMKNPFVKEKRIFKNKTWGEILLPDDIKIIDFHFQETNKL